MKTLVVLGVMMLFILTMVVSCIIVQDSKIDNSNLFREDIKGNKESGIDLTADLDQDVGNSVKRSDK